jgi:hypothetical protein
LVHLWVVDIAHPVYRLQKSTEGKILDCGFADDHLILKAARYHPHKNRSQSAKPGIPRPRSNTYRFQLLTMIEAIIEEVAINTESRQGGPILHYSNTLWRLILAEPNNSDLAQRTRFSKAK